MINTYEYSISPEIIDSLGLITIPRFCGTIINAIGQNIRIEGYGIDVMSSYNQSWVLRRSAFEIDRRPKLYSTIYISVWPILGGPLNHQRCIRIIDQNKQEIGRGMTEWCVIDIESRKPIFSDFTINANGESAPCLSPQRIKEFEPILTSERTVCFSDCDFNGHLNNTRYVDMIYDLLPDEVIISNSSIRLDINYRHEALRGSKILMGLSNLNPNRWFFIARNNSQTLCSASLRLGK